MPYTGKPKGYDQYIGHGSEKMVYGSTDDETKVVKESHSRFKHERDYNFIKAQYYLSKILHLLLPKNIPDIHYTSIEDGQHITIDQRVKQSEGETKKDKDLIEFMSDRSELVKKF